MTNPPATAATNSLEDLLAQVFGFSQFRPGQEEIVRAVVEGQDVLAIMPTGGGKSLCYQLPALAREGLTVVISPLIALMRDQVGAMQQAGVAAASLTSGNTPEENDEIFSALEDGRLKLLYIAPERLAVSATTNLLRRSGCSLIAVDEAHCVSQWGHDFRPDYLRIGELRRALGVPLAAFTATADAATRAEIAERLFDGGDPPTFLRGFDRPNIRLAFAVKDNPRKQILAFADVRRGQSGIVYCATRARTESLAKALSDLGHAARAYHGGLEDWERRKVEGLFQTEEGLIVCATVAFGMGVDKPDVRWVAHADLPKSIEAYYQEIGRAGRDGLPADTLTLFGPDDIRLRRAQIDESNAPPERRQADHGRLNTLLGLAEATSCRRRMLLAYFGELSEPCGNCDLCETPARLFDATESVRMALSAMLRTGESFGTNHLIDILTGNSTAKVKQRGHDTLPTFAVGQNLKRASWQAVFRQMMGRDLVRPDPERYGALRMTDIARPILRGESTLQFRADSVEKASSRHEPKALVSDEDAPMLSALKAHRRQLAQDAKVPPYFIFNDRTLIEMAEKRPDTLDAFARITGVGATKLERHGASFLSILTGNAETTEHPARLKLAAKGGGTLYDRLLEIEHTLTRGACGTLKPMSLTTAQRARLASQKPSDSAAVARLIGDKASERFSAAFLDAISEE